jgi:tyrosyl-tRNA synthetase
MSKSLGNAIGIQDPAPEMYGKLMSINDELMWRYYTLLTDLTQRQIDLWRAEVSDGKEHPMAVKKKLAHLLTADFHSVAEADAAAEAWATQFQRKGIAGDLPEIEVSVAPLVVLLPIESTKEPAVDYMGTILNVAKLLHAVGLASSAGEATRKLQENAVSFNGEKFSGRYYSREALGDSPTLRLGKKSVRVKWVA